MLPNKHKNKAKIILLILDWNPRRKLKHFTDKDLQWILYETPEELVLLNCGVEDS